MPRLALHAAALVALAGLSGCYSYDVSATNDSAQDVRISLVKGKRHVHLSDVVLAPGGSAEWSGQTNGPIVVRVAAAPGGPQVSEIVVPRRTLTELDIYSAGGALAVRSNVASRDAEDHNSGQDARDSHDADAMRDEHDDAAVSEHADAPAADQAPITNTYEEPEAAPPVQPENDAPPPVDLIEDGR